MFLQNVKCLRYGKLRYVTWGWKTRISLSSVIMRWLQHAQAYVKYSKVNVNLYRALSCSTSKALRYGPCVTRGSHSFTCQPHTNLIFAFTPKPQGVTALWLVPTAPTTKGWPGWVDLGDWLPTKINVMDRELNPNTVTHPSTNRARRRLTLLIESKVLPLHQTMPLYMYVACCRVVWYGLYGLTDCQTDWLAAAAAAAARLWYNCERRTARNYHCGDCSDCMSSSFS